jgi:hypothetical protein
MLTLSLFQSHFLTQVCPVPRRYIHVRLYGHNRHIVQLLARHRQRVFFTSSPDKHTRYGRPRGSGVKPTRVRGRQLNRPKGTVINHCDIGDGMFNNPIHKVTREMTRQAIALHKLQHSPTEGVLNPFYTPYQRSSSTHLELSSPALPIISSKSYPVYTPILSSAPHYPSVTTNLSVTTMIDFHKLCRAIQAFR